LAKAVRDADGPIYIHCHHGKHRSPAAAAVACVANGYIEPHEAVRILNVAGTNPNYRGLFDAVAHAARMSDSAIDACAADFQETVKLPALAEAMVGLDETFERLKDFALVDWKTIPSHPDLHPVHETLLLVEHFQEIERLESVQRESKEFLVQLKESIELSRQLMTLLEVGQTSISGRINKVSIDRTFQAISSNCAECHRQFRDFRSMDSF
jgi:hypothetical protein